MPDSDQHPAQPQRTPTSGDMAASWVQALADIRYDMRQGLQELSRRLGKIEETLSISSTDHAVTKVKLDELVVQQVHLESRVNELEHRDRERAVRESEVEKARQPRQYGPAMTALITVMVTVLVSPVLAWVLVSLGRFVAHNPQTVTEAKP